MKKDYKISFVLGKEFLDDFSEKQKLEKRTIFIMDCKSKKHAKKRFWKLLKKYHWIIREYTYEDYKTDTILREDPEYFNEQEYPS